MIFLFVFMGFSQNVCGAALRFSFFPVSLLHSTAARRSADTGSAPMAVSLSACPPSIVTAEFQSASLFRSPLHHTGFPEESLRRNRDTYGTWSRLRGRRFSLSSRRSDQMP